MAQGPHRFRTRTIDPGVRLQRRPLPGWPLLLMVLASVQACTVGTEGTPSTEGSANDTPGDKADNGTEEGLPKGIRWVRDAAEYRAASIQTYRLAALRLEQIVEEENYAPDTWGVSLDADETTLSNLQYEIESYEPNPTSFPAWVRRQEATAMPGVVAFTQKVHELGGYVAIVTNRSKSFCADTEDNLTKQGVPFDIVLCKTGSSQKESRWKMLEDGTTPDGLPPIELVMWIGDNIQDFPYVTQNIHSKPESDYGAFGERFFVIPNPMYGSWD
ncbi:MAG: hypothetical protein KC416_01315 [Myxococcales bacterium]|nr:hypothetical protein [Myxococcales bacterium]